MKGVNYIFDSRKRIKAVQIDIKTIEQHEEKIEDLLDAIIAESRKDETKRPWAEVKKSLKQKGKI